MLYFIKVTICFFTRDVAESKQLVVCKDGSMESTFVLFFFFLTHLFELFLVDDVSSAAFHGNYSETDSRISLSGCW